MEKLYILINSIFNSLCRNLFIEYYRILNHILAITTHIIDIGLFLLMLWLFEEREKLINFIELLSGNRLHVILFLIIKLRYDLTINFMIFIIWLLILFIKKLKEIIIILFINYFWISRLLDIGIINFELCIYFGLSGIISRSCYILLDYRIIILSINYLIFGFNSDSLDRFNLRVIEIIISSCNIYSLIILSRKELVLKYYY